jgi:Putative transposase
VAIDDHRIVACEDSRVTFTYRKVGSNRRRKMTLDAMEFLRRFLQHVMPSGFQKVRSYGFLSPAGAVALEVVRWLIALHLGAIYVPRSRRDETAPAGPVEPACPVRGGPLVRLGFVPAPRPTAFDTS